MSDVSVIGLGAMGSALAHGLLRGSRAVTVWNRTSHRAAPLVSGGASQAPNAASAVIDSPVLIICVSDYAATQDILAAPGVRTQLSGKVVVQLNTGTPAEAQAGAQWALECGAEYLDGAILAYPNQIGTPDDAVLLAGASGTFGKCESLLQPLAGGITPGRSRYDSCAANGTHDARRLSCDDMTQVCRPDG